MVYADTAKCKILLKGYEGAIEGSLLKFMEKVFPLMIIIIIYLNSSYLKQLYAKIKPVK